ncbi:MAG TPA: HNH endonuclease signature motif containing protein, partial [Micromonosporaceae bacterium]
VAVGHLDTGAILSVAATRRIACQAGILPVVLNGASIPIDVGRSRRPYTGAARTAVLLRDGGCAFPGCDRPSRWTEIHHIRHWSQGGGTDRDNGVALCSRHHHVIHQPDTGWTVRLGPDQRPEFLPPTHLDPDQRPRRNPYHQRN